jgi:hypothetical protein
LTGQTTLESIGLAGETMASNTFSISGDGRFVVFSELTSSFPGGLYLRDRQAGQTTRLLASTERTGSIWLSVDGRFISFITFQGNQEYLQVLDRSSGQFNMISVCGDCQGYETAVAGNVVAFGSTASLVSNDTNRTHDIFVAMASPSPGAPDPPANLTYTLAGPTLTLTWAATGSGPAATEYVIEAGIVSYSSDSGNFSTGSANTTFSTPFDSRTTFYIRVRAANAAGVSFPSNEVVLALAALPGAPANLVTSVAGTNVALTWSAASGPVVSYVIEAGSASGLTDLANFNTGSLNTTYSASGVVAGTYFVRVRAASAGGVGPASNEGMIVVTNTCPPPSPPTGLTRSVSGSSVTLAWNAGSGAASYVLEAGSSAGATDLVGADLQSSATTFMTTGVSPGSYFVRLRSTNACGQSAPSNEVTVIVAQ